MTLHSFLLFATAYRLHDCILLRFLLPFIILSSKVHFFMTIILLLHSMLPDEDVFGESSAMGRYRTMHCTMVQNNYVQ